MNYEDMSNKQINKKVAELNGLKESPVSYMMYGDGLVVYPHSNEVNFDPCNNPSDAWPVIEMIWERLMQVDDYYHAHTKWEAYCIEHGVGKLRAAMICFLKMKDAEK